MLFCGSNDTVKKGLSHGSQRWLCKACGKHFSKKKKDSASEIRSLYSSGKYSLDDISKFLGISRSTVCRALRNYIPEPQTQDPRKIIAMMDATYWGTKIPFASTRGNFRLVQKNAHLGIFFWLQTI
ncbi:transposase-like zinc-binding domain-containing protein [Fibrobacter intestinalis]|uniref:transposase-like zinc-binding domain-containing protein n=1 Tax=Fibrobacter intestinalis TaxID=28122 RepID=UPI000933A751